MTPEQLQILRNEIDSNTDLQGLDNKQAAIELNTATEQINVKDIYSDDVYAALDMTEMGAATEEQWGWVKMVISNGKISPKKSIDNVRLLIANIYIDMPTTKAALLALTYQNVSKAEILELSEIKYWDVGQARAI